MKKIIALLLQVILILSIAACSAVGANWNVQAAAESVTADVAAVIVSPLSVEYDSEDLKSQRGRKRDNPTEWEFNLL